MEAQILLSLVEIDPRRLISSVGRHDEEIFTGSFNGQLLRGCIKLGLTKRSLLLYVFFEK